MKLSSISLMKLVIKMLIFLIILVLVGMLSAILYSAKFWPDVYNYINANITIKRIPTISELELTVIEVGYTTDATDIGTTTDIDYDMTTDDDFNIDSFMADEFGNKKAKREIVVEQMKDYIELPSKGIFVDYIFLEEPATTEREENRIIKQVIAKDIRNKQNQEKIDGILKGLEDLNKDIENDHTVSEEPMFTKQYYTVQPITHENIKRSPDESIKQMLLEDMQKVTTDYLESTTTINEVLVSYDIKSNNRITATQIKPEGRISVAGEPGKDISLPQTTLITNKDSILVNGDTNFNDDGILKAFMNIKLNCTSDGILVGDDSDDSGDETISNLTIDSIDITTDNIQLIEIDQNSVSTKTMDSDVTESTTMFMKDLVDETKLSTKNSEEVEIVSNEYEKLSMTDPICFGDPKCQHFTKAVYPWIASIFIKTDAQTQFNYYCDGALLSERVIITDARCLFISNSSVDPDNVLLFLGKANLQAFGSDEKILRVNQIILHPNFTSEIEVKHDLALLVLEEAVELSEKVQTACFHDEQDLTEVEKAGTTSWALNGDMMPIFFEKPNELCFDKSEDVFCATYGYDVPLCPNYGGIYATKRADAWCLQGIRFGDPADRGVCYTKNVFYTSLQNYKEWINNVVEINKNNL